MPRQPWSDKRERQYEHIKDGLRDRGESEDTAEEIAARTVNKERARAGEARTASRSSVPRMMNRRTMRYADADRNAIGSRLMLSNASAV